MYIRGGDSNGNTHVQLIAAKTKVAPLKRLTIPRLELCGAYLLTQLLEHIKVVYQVLVDRIYAWTDSMIVSNWLTGFSRRFKTFVGNRVSTIIDTFPPTDGGMLGVQITLLIVPLKDYFQMSLLILLCGGRAQRG